jgi:hypothetical protein
MPNTAPVHNALCIAALDPSLIATKFVNIVIETRGDTRSAVLSSITRSGRSARPIGTSRSPPSAILLKKPGR